MYTTSRTHSSGINEEPSFGPSQSEPYTDDERESPPGLSKGGGGSRFESILHPYRKRRNRKPNPNSSRRRRPERTPLLRTTLAAQVLAEEPVEPEWIWRDYIAKGVVTVLAGRPKEGKTTFLLRALRAIALGETFLDRATHQSGVLYLSEQPRFTLRQHLEPVPIHLVSHQDEDVRGESYEEVIRRAVMTCQAHGLDVLVVDSFARWADGDQENDARAMIREFKPLEEAAAAGLAVVLVHHTRKNPGTFGDDLRGSNALSGAAATVVTIRRTKAGGSRRVLRAVSWFDSAPETLVIEREEDGSYRALSEGEGEEETRAEAEERERQELLALIIIDAGKTTDDLAEEFPRSKALVKRRLAELLADEQIRHEGGGVRGDPFRWYVVAAHDLAIPEAPRNESSLGVTDS
jgi:KaiC/GvpD/RAD55 family RecA-like ATPase